MKFETFQTVMSNVNECEVAFIDTLTNVTLKGGRKNPYQGRVQKSMKNAQILLCASNKHENGYENNVRNRLISEGKNPDNFALQPRKWGTRMEDMPVVVHTKDGVVKHYLEVIFESGGVVEYHLDGVVVDPTTIEGFEVNSSEPSDGQGGLQNKVIIRTFDMDSVVELRINNVSYN